MTAFHKLNLLNSKSLDDVLTFTKTAILPYYSAELDYITPYEIEHADKWPGEHFTYKLNKYAFRNDVDIMPNQIDLAAFGCSFTFGVGLPNQLIWPHLLAKELNLSYLNFGVGGRSIATCVDLFLIVSKHIKIDKAVFLFPSIERLQIAKKYPDWDSNEVFHLSVMGNYESKENKFFELDEKIIYRALPIEEMKKIAKNQIYLLEHMAKLRNVKVYISSWDLETYYFLRLLDLEYVLVLPPWMSGSKEFADKDKARDNMHPGPLHHEKWFNEIKDIVK